MEVSDFLSPKSMLTPAIAGGLVMIITNTLWLQFGLSPKWIALLLSFLIALLVWGKQVAPIWDKLIYGFFNWLIIFTFAVGTNHLSSEFANQSITNMSQKGIHQQWVNDWFK